MFCPECNCNNDMVIDSRSTARGRGIRRRRKCGTCGHRFTTIEINRDDLSDIHMKGIVNKGERMEKQPVIIMTISLSGVTVGIDNTEDLKPEQRLGFELLTAKVQNFASDLIFKVTEKLNARPESVN